MGEGLDLRVLGAIDVVRDGRPLATGGPKPRLLLALLVAHRGSLLSSDRLCEELWGDAQPANPVAVLQSHVSRLRRLLRPEAEIVSRPPGYVLQVDADRVDAERFERLCTEADHELDSVPAAETIQRALALWRGRAYDEFADVESLRATAVRLSERRAKATEDLVEARLAHGEHAEVVGELEALVREHPLRGRLWEQLAVALYRCGRAPDALRRLSEYRDVLRDELGLDVPPRVAELERKVLEDDPSLAGSPRASAESREPQLPAFTTELIGRDETIEEILAELPRHRLVTLTGPGGVGKTRVALQVARRIADDGGAPVRFVDLVPVREAAGAAVSIADAFGVKPRLQLSVEDTLLEYLRGRRAWLVLDNCEHLRDDVAALVERLLGASEELGILATSREVLGLPGERVRQIAPLPVPDADAPLGEVAASPGVRLFVERARAARADFDLDGDNAQAVTQIVRAVDALPLGIELAAARIRAMSAAVLAERLAQHRDVLAGARTSAVPRHRTLHDLARWSYDLLDDEERSLFARLSVFAGTFDLDAAEAVCANGVASPAEVPALLATLVDKSMVQLVDGARSRYRVLEILREFGDAQLTDTERDECHEQHARWFLDLAERLAAELTGPGEPAAVLAADRDLDNFRAATVWALRAGDHDVALRLVAALREYCFRGMHAEIVEGAERAIALPGALGHHRAPLAIAIVAYGRFTRGESEAAIELAERALALARELGAGTSGLAERVLGNACFFLGDVAGATVFGDRMVESARGGSHARLAHALYMRAVGCASIGDVVRGAQLAGEAAAVARRCGSPTALAQAAYALGVTMEATDADEAAEHLHRAVELARAARNRWVEAFALTEVLWLQARQGDPKGALAQYGDVVDIWYRGGDWANQWLSLRHLFGILVQLGSDTVAATLYGALTAAGAANALPFELGTAQRLATSVTELRQRLGATAFASAVARGAALPDAEVVALARATIDEFAG